jgi:hypothetical protein
MKCQILSKKTLKLFEITFVCMIWTFGLLALKGTVQAKYRGVLWTVRYAVATSAGPPVTTAIAFLSSTNATHRSPSHPLSPNLRVTNDFSIFARYIFLRCATWFLFWNHLHRWKTMAPIPTLCKQSAWQCGTSQLVYAKSFTFNLQSYSSSTI